MLIDFTTAVQGNGAMASVLLLYYHLLREGGITHEQTVYVNPDDFNTFEYLTVEVTKDQQGDIDQKLLREGATIYLLCELNDVVTDYETDYLSRPFAKRILDALARDAVTAIPHTHQILQLVSEGEANLDYPALQRSLHVVYEEYVVRKFRSLSHAGEA
jgi:hypothetical protein